MKNLFLAILALFISQTTFAIEVDEQITECQKPLKNSDEELICSGQVYRLLSKSNTTKSIKSIPFGTYDHLYFGFPDDSMSRIYSYDRAILSKADGKLMGYLNIFAIAYDETGWRTQFKAYYSKSGKLLAVFISDI